MHCITTTVIALLRLFMATCQLCWPPAIPFYHCRLFFSRPNLRGCLGNHQQTLPRLMAAQIYKIQSESWVAPSPQIWRPKHQNFGEIVT